MPSPADQPVFDLDAMRAAARRWAARRAERDRKTRHVQKGDYHLADTPERVAKRIEKLAEAIREAVESRDADDLPAELTEAMGVEPAAMSDRRLDATLERVIGATRDFLGMEFLEDARQAARGVCRLATPLGGGRHSYGTGFLVTPRLLLTNHHVLPSADAAGRTAAEFDYQRDGDGRGLPVAAFALEPGRFFLADKKLDFALVAVAPTSDRGTPLADYPYLPLIREEGKAVIGECLNVIQHPMGRMKEVVIRENRLLDLPGEFAHYAADTEPGSSGSPVFNDQWQVIALHHSGVPKTDAAGNYLRTDGGVWKRGDPPEALDWVANEGIRVSKLVAFIEKAAVRPHEEELRAELLDPPGPPTPSPADGDDDDAGEVTRRRMSKTRPQTPNGKPSMNGKKTADANGAVTLTVPLHITITLGGAANGVPGVSVKGMNGVPALTEGTGPAPKPDLSDAGFQARKGYDPKFLAGLTVPLPKPSGALKPHLLDVTGKPGTAGKFELKYHHYSVLMHQPRKLAVLSAVNFFAAAPHRAERGKDKWFADPRAGAAQSVEKNYAHPKIDRGHLTRRADGGWGMTAAEARQANDDTFFFTNNSPQHSFFNQSNFEKKGFVLWGSLENHVAAQAKTSGGRLCVFNGPVLTPADPTLDGLPVPLSFYKLIAYKTDAGDLSAVAFVMDQTELIEGIVGGAEEGFEEDFDPGRFTPHQVTVDDLERRTGLDFGPLREADALESAIGEGAVESTEAVKRIESLDDIVL